MSENIGQPTPVQRVQNQIDELIRERDLYKRMLERYEPDPTYSTPTEIDRLRARVAELEAAASPDDAHTTTETRTEWREVLINDEQFSWSIPASGVAMARKHPAYRVESRTVSTTTRTTDWKAEQ